MCIYIGGWHGRLSATVIVDELILGEVDEDEEKEEEEEGGVEGSVVEHEGELWSDICFCIKKLCLSSVQISWLDEVIANCMFETLIYMYNVYVVHVLYVKIEHVHMTTERCAYNYLAI